MSSRRFYLTLPSNSSMVYYPSNTEARYAKKTTASDGTGRRLRSGVEMNIMTGEPAPFINGKSIVVLQFKRIVLL